MRRNVGKGCVSSLKIEKLEGSLVVGFGAAAAAAGVSVLALS